MTSRSCTTTLFNNRQSLISSADVSVMIGGASSWPAFAWSARQKPGTHPIQRISVCVCGGGGGEEG